MREYSSTAGLHFDDRELESRLVWIWTMARSGSTWLLRMLTHPVKLIDSSQDPGDMVGFAVPRTWQGSVDAIPVDTTFVANHLLPLAGAADYNDDLAPLTFSSALGLRTRANYFFSSKYEDAWRPELRRMMLVRFQRLVERTAERYDVNSPLILLKEVAGAHAAPLIMSLFPRSKLLFLVRDGRDVVDSQTAANQPGTWLPVSGWTTADERHEFVRRRARTWVGDVASIERAFDAHPAELRKMVRYEDLLAEPGQNLRTLVEWLGLNRTERWLERAVEANAFESIAPEQKGPKKFFRSASPGAWRKNLTADEASILETVMGDKLRQLGYPIDETEPGTDDTPDSSSGPESGSGDPPARGWIGSPRPPGGVVSAYLQGQGEGRDYSDLGRLVQKRGSPTSRRDRMVALTFDDGPVLQTHRVMETLESYGARGTFFLVGRRLEGHQALIRRLVRAGHEIGNHSYGHFAFPSHEDLTACAALLEQAAGRKPGLYRPPFGAIDRPGAEAAIEDGMRVILWNVDSEDGVPPWQGISAGRITDNVLKQVAPGAIILLHDGLPWSRAVDALPKLIEGLQQNGYRLVTVSELLLYREAPRRRRGGRVLRRLRTRLLGKAAATAPAGNAAAGKRVDGRHTPSSHRKDGRGDLVELLGRIAVQIDPPSEAEVPGDAGRLARGACAGLADPRLASDLLVRHTAAHEVNALRVIALGFAMRRFEDGAEGATALPEPLTERLTGADDSYREAGRIAHELAGPTRVNRLMAARLTEQAPEAASIGARSAPDISEPAELPAEPSYESASPEFLAIFGSGSEVCDQVGLWGRETGREVARRQMRALLDAAGVDDDFDIDPLVERIDVDYLFRYGYALAACEERLSAPQS